MISLKTHLTFLSIKALDVCADTFPSPFLRQPLPHASPTLLFTLKCTSYSSKYWSQLPLPLADRHAHPPLRSRRALLGRPLPGRVERGSICCQCRAECGGGGGGRGHTGTRPRQPFPAPCTGTRACPPMTFLSLFKSAPSKINHKIDRGPGMDARGSDWRPIPWEGSGGRHPVPGRAGPGR